MFSAENKYHPCSPCSPLPEKRPKDAGRLLESEGLSQRVGERSRAKRMVNMTWTRKTVLLSSLALAGSLDLARAFQGSGPAPMPSPMDGLQTSPQFLSRRQGSDVLKKNGEACIHRRSAASMTEESPTNTRPSPSSLVSPLKSVPQGPTRCDVSTNMAGFSSIPVGAPREGKKALPLRGATARTTSRDSLNCYWIPVGGGAKHT